jgi:hypothetical protein
MSAERNELVERARSRSGRAEDARRARLIPMLAVARSYSEVRRALDRSMNHHGLPFLS